MKNIEIACFSAEDAKLALELGANRIEFCEDYQCGGLTPDLDEFILLRSQFPDAQIHVMIRPRDGDFVYSTYKIEIMLSQIESFKNAGADGFVFGVLNANNTINYESCQKLIEATKKNRKTKAVFHRAIDSIINKEEALERIIELGFDGVLSSGGEKTAFEGRQNLKTWVEKYGDKLEIIAGGGIRSTNITHILESGVEWIHSAAWDVKLDKVSHEELSKIINMTSIFEKSNFK